MTRFIVVLLGALFAANAYAIPVHPYYQDIKLPTQSMVEHQNIAAPLAIDPNRFFTANAGDTSGIGATVTSFLAQPDVPRSVIVTPGTPSSSVKAGNVIVSGTDFFGKVISESIAISAGQTTPSYGTKAFKTITAVGLPAENSPFSATWSVGMGARLGLKRCMGLAGDIFHAELGGVKEATAPAVLNNTTTISGNTVSLSSALNGSDVDVYFIQNFRCFP
jgi:hypothetical protein